MIKHTDTVTAKNVTFLDIYLVNTSIHFPGKPVLKVPSQILFNGQWLSGNQFTKTAVSICYLSFKHSIKENHNLILAERDFFSLRVNKGKIKKMSENSLSKRDVSIVDQELCAGITENVINASAGTTGSVLVCNPATCYMQSMFLAGNTNATGLAVYSVSFQIFNTGGNVKPIALIISSAGTQLAGANVKCTATYGQNIGATPTDITFNFGAGECYLTNGVFWNFGLSGSFSGACASNNVSINTSPVSSLNFWNSSYGIFTNFAVVSSSSDVSCTGLSTITMQSNNTIFTDFTINTCAATQAPTSNPTTSPTKSPTQSPTVSPTTAPTKSPTVSPTMSPSASPTVAPTENPTEEPTEAPTLSITSVQGVALSDSSFSNTPTARKRDGFGEDIDLNTDQCAPIFQTALNRTLNISFGAPQRCIGQTFLTSNVTVYLTSVSVLAMSNSSIDVRPMELYVLYLGPNPIPSITYIYRMCIATNDMLLPNGVPTLITFTLSNCPLIPNIYYSLSFTCSLNANCLTHPVFLFQESKTAIQVNSISGGNSFTGIKIVSAQSVGDCVSGTPNYTVINNNVFSGLSMTGCSSLTQPTPVPTFTVPSAESPTGEIVDINLAAVDVYAAWTQPNMAIITGVLYTLDVWFTKPGLNFLYECNGSCDLVVPDEFYLTGDSFVMFVYDNASLIYQNAYPVNPYVSCPVPTSPISPIWAQSWVCFGVLGRFLLVSSIIGLIAIFIMSIFLLAFIIYLIVYCCMNRNSASVINNITMATENAKSNTADAIAAFPLWYQQMMAVRASPADALLIILCVPLLFGGVGAVAFNQCGNTSTPLIIQQSCQYTFSLSGKDIVCNGGICDVNFNYQVTFALLGQSICLNFLDTNGNVFTTLQLTYQYQIRSVQLVYSYTTYSWTPVSTSYKGCPSTSTCPISGCPNPPPFLNPNSGNDVFNNYAIAALPTYLNSSFINSIPVMPNLACSASCGCAGCGCFFCNSGCLWTYFSFVPTGNEFYVFTPTTQYSYPVLNGMFYRPGATCYDSLVNLKFKTSSLSSISAQSAFSQATLSVSSSASTSGSTSPYLLNFVLLSSVITEDVNFGGKSVICDMKIGSCYLGLAAPANGPISGIVGDIQYAVDSLTNQVWNPASVIITQLQNSASFAFPPVGARFVDGTGTNPYIKFPVQLGNTVYEIANYNLGGLENRPGPLTLGINTLVGFQVSYTDTTVCPSVSLHGVAAGCSSCALGATISLDVISTCSSGYAFVSIDGPALLGTQSVYLDVVSSTVTITFFPSAETGSFTLSVFYKTYSSNVTFSGFFPIMAEIDNGSWTIQNNVSTTISSNNITGWWDNLGIGIKVGIGFSIGIGSLILVVGSIIVIGIIVVKLRSPSSQYQQL